MGQSQLVWIIELFGLCLSGFCYNTVNFLQELLTAALHFEAHHTYPSLEITNNSVHHCCSLTGIANNPRVIPDNDDTTVFLLDGTEVDSETYFQSLPNQTSLIFKREKEHVFSGADLIYNALKTINIEVLRAGDIIKDFLDENLKEKVRILAEVLNKQDNNNEKVKLSKRDEDPDWFVGLETNALTKEAFMFRRSQERIRSYLYKTKSDIKKSESYNNNPELRETLDSVFTVFSELLSKNKYFGCLFDRSAEGALCDVNGQFQCFGIWKNNECLYNEGNKHITNPYSSREERIVFSTWNLDHGIERSRTIIPALVNAAELVCQQKDRETEVNVVYFYSLLFTRSNLRLVHIVCHDKGKHFTAKCDPDKILVSCSRKRNTFKTKNFPAVSSSQMVL